MILTGRLEAATEGSRELDEAIALAAFPGGTFDPGQFPHYTTSLDAALTLVLKGWGWELRHFWNHLCAVSFAARLFSPHDDIEQPGTVYAKTPALAICIAAFKARSK